MALYVPQVVAAWREAKLDWPDLLPKHMSGMMKAAYGTNSGLCWPTAAATLCCEYENAM